MAKTYFIKCSECLEVSEVFPSYSILGTRCPECGCDEVKTVDENGEKE